MNIIKKLRLDEEYVFVGPIHDLEKFLLSSKEPKVERISRQEYLLTPGYSVGTTTMMHRPLMELQVVASITAISKDYQQIKFTTTPRVEHFFIGIIFLFFLVLIVTQKESLWLYPFIIGLWCLSHAWFHVLYRAQEEEVVDKVVRRLRLIDKSRFQLLVP